MIHHYRMHPYKYYYNSFYACIQYYKDKGSGSRCNGMFSEDDVPALVDPKIRQLRYTIRNEVEEHSKIYSPEDFPNDRHGSHVTPK